MQINKITVKKLFGTRDFELTLKNGHGFFFGENGAGKTTFLNILYAILSGEDNLIPQGLEFQKFEIEFEDGKKISKIQTYEWPKDTEDSGRDYKNFYSQFTNQLNQYQNYLKSIKVNYPELENIKIDDVIKAIENENTDVLIQNSILNKNILTLNNSIAQGLGNSNPSQWFNNIINNYTHMTRLIKQNNLQLVRTILDNVNNDILYLNVYRNRPKINGNEANIYEEGKIVLTSAKLDELKQKVQTSAQKMKELVNTYYKNMSDTLLDRLLSTDSENVIELRDEDKEIIERVFEYIHGINQLKKDKLKKILFREDNEGNINNILIESFKPFIDQYRLEALPVEEKIKKFANIVNKYMVHKQINFDKNDFKFKIKIGNNEQVLDEKLLSSGEKHIFSVFSNLVFNQKESIHLLIDEPELSLSINWQKMFIEDITGFEKVKNLIFVTHSPYVIPENMIEDLQRFPSGNEHD